MALQGPAAGLETVAAASAAIRRLSAGWQGEPNLGDVSVCAHRLHELSQPGMTVPGAQVMRVARRRGVARTKVRRVLLRGRLSAGRGA